MKTKQVSVWREVCTQCRQQCEVTVWREVFGRFSLYRRSSCCLAKTMAQRVEG